MPGSQSITYYMGFCLKMVACATPIYTGSMPFCTKDPRCLAPTAKTAQVYTILSAKTTGVS